MAKPPVNRLAPKGLECVRPGAATMAVSLAYWGPASGWSPGPGSNCLRIDAGISRCAGGRGQPRQQSGENAKCRPLCARTVVSVRQRVALPRPALAESARGPGEGSVWRRIAVSGSGAAKCHDCRVSSSESRVVFDRGNHQSTKDIEQQQCHAYRGRGVPDRLWSERRFRQTTVGRKSPG